MKKQDSCPVCTAGFDHHTMEELLECKISILENIQDKQNSLGIIEREILKVEMKRNPPTSEAKGDEVRNE